MTRSTKQMPAPSGVRYFRNVSPMGALWLPLTGAVVPRGGLVMVPAERAAHIESQDVWDEVSAKAALAEYNAELAEVVAVPDSTQDETLNTEGAEINQDEPSADQPAGTDEPEA